MGFGEELRKIRESRGMTVNQLAMYSDISAASISRYETGERGTPKPPTIEKLAKGLKIDYNYLMQVAGHLEEPNEETQRETAQKLLEFLDLDMANEEIKKRIKLKVDNLVLNSEEMDEFIDWVRVKRLMKKQQQPALESEGPLRGRD